MLSRELDDILRPVYCGYIAGHLPKITDSLVEIQKWAYSIKAKKFEVRRCNYNFSINIEVLHSYQRLNIKSHFTRVK
jgi:hypothetical protein